MEDDRYLSVEIEMEMRANEDIEMGQDITPPLPPLSFSLYDSSLSSHCSSCFRPLSTTTTTTTTTASSFLRYCSLGDCSSSDSPLHSSSAEHHLLLLLLRHPSLYPHPDSSDLRSALRLFHRLSSTETGNGTQMGTGTENGNTTKFNGDVPKYPTGDDNHFLSPPPPPRLFGLLTNSCKLLSDDDNFARVRAGARAMAMARAMRDGREIDSGDCECEMEEAVLCLVVTNAVEINVDGERPIGIGVYDGRFSWINHSCSPNSCYQFVVAFDEGLKSADGEPLMRIEPCGDETTQMEGTGAIFTSELSQGSRNYGPRMIVRSIKGIQRGEEVTTTYTDLLQPTTMRQSELLLKYQFICNCRRCCALPQTYVDHALQETFFTHIRNNSPRSLTNLDMETAVERLRDVFDGTIMEYMEVGNPVSCCEKIEGLLFQFNPHLEQTRGVSHTHLRLSPLHHLSLNGYTTLHSTYKIRSGFKSIDGERFNSFDMSRISAAYSLLLAGATHHLFLYECSLIVSSATFLVNAGESLLHLARSSSWNLFPKCMSQNLSSIFNLKCPRCLLMDKFGSDFSPSQTRNREFDDICREFLTCLSIIIPKVWSFLVQGCLYLEDIKDPTDFSWLGDMRRTDTWDFNPMKCADKEPADDMRTNIFQLGIHCLMYGGYLSCICYGDNQYRTRKMIQC